MTPFQQPSPSAGPDDSRTLDLLVRAHRQRVFRFGLRVCRDAFDADDAVQDAFIALGNRPDVMRHAGMLSWLMTTVRHACQRMLRPFAGRARPTRLPVEHLEQLPSADPHPEAALEQARVVEQVNAAIQRLEPAYRDVLVLREIEALSGDEVCAALGLSTNAM
ncbi:MAG TPA: sigma-70 family RNA polymerase sigma factor, partial [bacterium]